MNALNKAKEPFKFYTQLHIPELTGLKAANLQELLDLIKTVPGSVIYHHTHRFLQQHQYLSPEPPNDFAYWITGILGEEELGRRYIVSIPYSIHPFENFGTRSFVPSRIILYNTHDLFISLQHPEKSSIL